MRHFIDTILFCLGIQTRSYTLWCIDSYLDRIVHELNAHKEIFNRGAFVCDTWCVKKDIQHWRTSLGNLEWSVKDYVKTGKITNLDNIGIIIKIKSIHKNVDEYLEQIRKLEQDGKELRRVSR